MVDVLLLHRLSWSISGGSRGFWSSTSASASWAGSRLDSIKSLNLFREGIIGLEWGKQKIMRQGWSWLDVKSLDSVRLGIIGLNWSMSLDWCVEVGKLLVVLVENYKLSSPMQPFSICVTGNCSFSLLGRVAGFFLQKSKAGRCTFAPAYWAGLYFSSTDADFPSILHHSSNISNLHRSHIQSFETLEPFPGQI